MPSECFEPLSRVFLFRKAKIVLIYKLYNLFKKYLLSLGKTFPMASKQLNFRVEEELINKLKYAAWFDRESITDVYIKAASEYVAKWEKKNGAITDDLLKKVKK